MVILEAPTSPWRCPWWQWRFWWQCRSGPEAASLCMARVYRVLHLPAQLMPSAVGSCTADLRSLTPQVLSKPASQTTTRCFLNQHMSTSPSQPGSSSAPPRSQIPCSHSFFSPGPRNVFWQNVPISWLQAAVNAGAGRGRYQSSTTEALSLYRK